MTLKTSLLVVFACSLALARPGAAQGTWSPKWEIPGYDFAPNGVWRGRAHAVREARRALVAARAYSRLNSAVRLAPAGAASSPMSVSGVLEVPVILIRFADTDTSSLNAPASYDSVLFSETPPYGRPYTIRTFYEQMSQGAFSMQGQVFGWVALSKPEASYTGGTNCTGNPYGTSNCNGIFTSSTTVPIDSLQAGLRDALAQLDATGVNWAQFYNSGEDDGIVDMAIFIHPDVDGACGSNNNIWSHRYVLTPPYVTRTPWAGHSGQFMQVRDYTIQSGVGGSTACNGSQIMPIGTAAHESGHGLDLPDLYDIEYASSGIGEWGLMGSGNYSRPFSPSRMEAWSLSEMGWVTVVPLTQAGTYSLGPAPTSDTTFIVRVQGANPRGEYFLLENREAVLADTALIADHCTVSGNPPNCGGGLMIWHVDSEQVANNGFLVTNLVNYGPVHGVELEQADGLDNLDRNPYTDPLSNRGDASDPYPGTTGNASFGFGTDPAATKNSDGSFVGFVIDSIQRLSVQGPVSFRLRFGAATTVQASDTQALVQVDGQSYHQFAALFDSTTTHTVAVADTQYRPDSLVRWVFVSWSDGQPITHTFAASLTGTSLTATLTRAFRLRFSTAGTGAVTVGPTGTANDAFLADGSNVQLTAHPGSGLSFLGWSGDTTAADTLLSLLMNQPRVVAANFGLPLSAPEVLQELFTGTSPLSAAQIRYVNALANRSDSTQIDVGSFLAWVRSAHPAPPGTVDRVASRQSWTKP